VERCVVTGASGLVGRELVDVVAGTGRRVIAWQRSAPSAARPPAVKSIEYRSVELGVTANADLDRVLAGVDAFIHCAWDLQAGTWAEIERINVRGSIGWFERAAHAGVKKLIFVSSVSAYPGCRSMYGRSKLLVEDAVTRLGGISVRPGIVHGDPSAGVYGRLWKSTNASVVPLIDGGHQKMLTIHRRDLALAIERLLVDYERWRGRVLVLGHPQLVTMRGLLEDIARSRGRSLRFVSVPGVAVMLALRSAEALGLKLQFRSDSLVTLRGPEPLVDAKMLEALGVTIRPFAP
jgi:nucleoside-diphosphate-sugar epimerase